MCVDAYPDTQSGIRNADPTNTPMISWPKTKRKRIKDGAAVKIEMAQNLRRVLW